MDTNLFRRIAFAAVAIPVALGLVWYGGLPLALLVATVGALGTRELFDLAKRQGVDAAGGFGIVASATVAPLTLVALVSPHTAALLAGTWPYLLAAFVIVLLGYVLWRRGPGSHPLLTAAVTTFGVLYAGGLPCFLLAIRHAVYPSRSWAAAWVVFFPLVITWVVDTAAMVGGRLIGGAKLAPTVSPAKTRAGAISGVVGGLLVAPLYVQFILRPFGIGLSWTQTLVFAGTLSIVGQVGDLAESLFKREAGVKDSSALIPGHGGVLDRFDSLYFVIPTAAGLYRLFGLI